MASPRIYRWDFTFKEAAMDISGHVKMLPSHVVDEDAVTSFVAGFNTFVSELFLPEDDDSVAYQLRIRQFNYDHSSYAEKWVRILGGWEPGLGARLYPEYLCQVMPDYSVKVTHVAVPGLAIWCELLDDRPT